jgi:hypothetical protein
MEKKQHLLSICIPTYNRPDKIKERILNLSKINNINLVDIIIVDNCSEIKVEDIYKESNFEIDNIKIMRNAVNIGGGANTLRCIEYANTKWVWILGDDDMVLDNSIDIILEDIQRISQTGNTAYIKYSTELGSIDKPIYIDNYKSCFNFITNNNFWGNMIFMSSTIVNREFFLRYYAKALANSYSRFTHIYPLFLLLYNNEADIYISDKIICTWCKPDPKYHWFWGIIYQEILKGFSSFVFITEKEIRIIARRWLGLNIKKIMGAYILLLLQGDKYVAKKVFKEYYLYYFSKIKMILLYPIYILFLLIIPKIKIIERLLRFDKDYQRAKEKTINMWR